jgi:hypothetical protein
MRCKGQEEMIGFALIMIIVAVILLVFLSFSLGGNQKDAVESYEVESFIQTILRYTTECRDNYEFLPVRKLISDCEDNEMCLNGGHSCVILEDTLKEIVEESWKVEGDRPIKGYKLVILEGENERLLIEKGNVTQNYKGATQLLPRSDRNYDIFFTAYY